MKVNVFNKGNTTFSKIKIGEVFSLGFISDFFIKTDYDKTGKGRAVNLEDDSLITVPENKYVEKVYNATLNIEM